jgi:histone H3/H4
MSRRHTHGSLEELEQPGLRRLAQKGGVKRMDKSSYEQLRGHMKFHLENIIRMAVASAQLENRKTIKPKDVQFALGQLGESIVI